MNEDLQKKLYSDFPDLYKSLDHFDIPDAWFDLVYDLSVKIRKLRNELFNYNDYFIVQVKSEFGELRYYMSTCTEEMNNLIATAEDQSNFICHSCCKNIYPSILNTDKRNIELKLCFKCNIIKNIIE